MDRPTKKQQELLDYIREFIASHGYGPSYREMMRALGYGSVSTVALHVDGLLQKRLITKKGRSARSLELATAKTSSVERVIQHKITVLQKNDPHDKKGDVATLQRALKILGS